jgi:hypothetical protein
LPESDLAESEEEEEDDPTVEVDFLSRLSFR